MSCCPSSCCVSSSSTTASSTSRTPSTGSRYEHKSLNAGGALDIVVVARPDGSLKSSPFHVVFDTLASWGAGRVSMQINGQPFECDPHLRVTKTHEPATFAGSTSPMPPPSVLSALAESNLLRQGQNEIRYSVGADEHSCVRAFVYLWRHDTPTVVFDVDGTVTLNDLAGQAAMFVDSSPTHKGVCELVGELHTRGYNLLYLTSRPLLGHAGIERTRRFLFEVAVDAPSGCRMPPAAVLTTTHVHTMQALAAELSGGSKAFKSSALKTIRSAFEASPAAAAASSPPSSGGGGLFAGFGNREKDALAYLSAGVPPERIFIVDPSSKVVGRASIVVAPAPAPHAAAGGGGTAADAPVPLPEPGPAIAKPPSWASYAQMLPLLDDIFPRRCSKAEAALRAAAAAAPASATERDGAVVLM